MPKGNKQKIKLLKLREILLRKTDEKHGLSLNELINELKCYDIEAERKSIYNDIETLKSEFNLNIERFSQRYHVTEREFELAEVKLLADAVMASRFITEKKTNSLIKKLKFLVSDYEGKEIVRQTLVQGRIKNMNESIYYNVDKIHSSINVNNKIKFKYFRYNTDKEIEYRNNGKKIIVSPWLLTWTDENYYLIAFDDYAKEIKHYRVDKMKDIEILENNQREGKEFFDKLDLKHYASSVFGMFQGEKCKLRLRFKNNLVGIFIDRFGKDIMLSPYDDNYSEVTLDLNISNQFYGWLSGIGKDVKIIYPERIKEEYKEYLKGLLDNYI